MCLNGYGYVSLPLLVISRPEERACYALPILVLAAGWPRHAFVHHVDADATWSGHGRSVREIVPLVLGKREAAVAVLES